MKRIFLFESRLRSGWTLAIWACLYSALTLGTQFGFATIPALRAWASSQPHGVLTPFGQIEFTGLELALLLLSVVLTAALARRRFDSHGLATPGNKTVRFVQGIVFGFAMGSALIGTIALWGGYCGSGRALDAHSLFVNGTLYGIGFFLVSFFEEFAFRGFLQTTLERGIGAWPAAVVLSLAFGAVHLPTAGAEWVFAVVAASFGLLAVFSVKRTGSLWFILGVHAAFDWSIAFFYSVPIAGQPAQGHLLNTSVTGPRWLTGGTAGPVASLMTFAVFGLAGLVLYFGFQKTQRLE